MLITIFMYFSVNIFNYKILIKQIISSTLYYQISELDYLPKRDYNYFIRGGVGVGVGQGKTRRCH